MSLKTYILLSTAAFLFVAVAANGETMQIPTGEESVISIAVSPDGKYLAVSSCNRATPRSCRVQVFRTSDGTVIQNNLTSASGAGVSVYQLKFTHCLNDKSEEVWCLVGYDTVSDRLIVWDILTGKVIKEYGKGSNPASTDGEPNPAVTIGDPVTTSPPVAVAVVEGEDGTVELRDGNDLRIGDPVPVPFPGTGSPVKGIAYAPDGSYVAVVGNGRVVCVVTGSYGSGKMTWTCRQIKLPGIGIEVDISPVTPHSKIVVTIADGNAVVIDKGTGKSVPLQGSKGFYECTFLSDGGTVVCHLNGTIGFWDAKTGKLKTKIKACESSTSLAAGPNNIVYVGCRGRVVPVSQPATTSTPTPSSSPAPSESPSKSPSESPTSTTDPSPTVSESPSPTPSSSPTPTPTMSLTPTLTLTPSPTPNPTPSL